MFQGHFASKHKKWGNVMEITPAPALSGGKMSHVTRTDIRTYILEVYRSSASGSASADIRMNFDIRILIRIRNISCGYRK